MPSASLRQCIYPSIAAGSLKKDIKRMGARNRVLGGGNLLYVQPTFSETPYSPKRDTMPTQEDHRAGFFEHYRKVAEESDKEFLKKHGVDLTTTLIFVSFSLGLLSHRAHYALRLVCFRQSHPHTGRPETRPA